MSLAEAKSALKKANKLLKGKNLEEIFTGERYQKEGPDKYTQDDEWIPQSLMHMYDQWAREVINDANNTSGQLCRIISTRIYKVVDFGRSAISDENWGTYYQGTLSESMIIGLTSKPPDRDAVNVLLSEIKPALKLLLETGINYDQLIKFMDETLVEEVQAK